MNRFAPGGPGDGGGGVSWKFGWVVGFVLCTVHMLGVSCTSTLPGKKMLWDS